MNEEASHQSHALRWTAGVLTVLLLYVLSFGPVVGLMDRGAKVPYLLPEWLTTFYRPVFWLHEHTPLERPLEVYRGWWIHILAEP